jgi:hypothetical protein
MSVASTIPETRPTANTPGLACALRRKDVLGRHGPIPFMAEVELKNSSDVVIEIEYWMTVLQHFNLIVTDAAGKIFSEGHYGDRFAPTEKPRVLRLGPGETYVADVHLFATAPRSTLEPGKYVVQGVYEYNGFRAVSEPVEVTV